MAAQNDYKSQAYSNSNAELAENYKQQQEFVKQMQLQASGQGPSAAQEMLKNSVQQQTAQANALAASQQGNINAGLATRNAQQMAGNAAQQAAGQGAVMRNQEQMQAQGMLGQQLNTMQGQGMQGSQFKDSLDAGIKQQNIEAQNKLINSVTGGLIGAAGSVGGAMAMSDERAKKDIQPGSDDIKNFLDALSAHSYEYKNPSQPGTGAGEHTSVMAQELEKSKVGSQMVMDTPQGKMVDYAKGLPAILAAQAELNKRLDRVEGKKKMAEGGQVDAKAIAGNAIKGFAEGFTGQEVKALPIKSPALMEPTVVQTAPTAPIYSETVTQLPAGASFAAQTLQKMNMGGMAKQPLTTPQIMAQHGAIVPGKAKVHGDSEKNDIVDAKLSPGEIVIPRTVVNSKDAPEAAKRFVAAILAKKGKK